MSVKFAVCLATLSLIPASATAGSCDGYVRQADKATGAALVKAYKSVITCDRAQAQTSFARFMLKATDMDTLVPLTLAAIDAELFQPVWDMTERLPYEYHVPLAEALGAACAEHPNVEPFVKGGYAVLKSTQFVSWKPVLSACRTPSLDAWMLDLVASPPKSPYNDKYNTIITTYTALHRMAALPVLEKAAIAAGNGGGPFNNIIETIQQAMQPANYADKVSDEDRMITETLLVNVANAVPPEQARLVADRLYTAGNPELAASLLPAVYPNRVQDDGSLLWAGAAIETCDGAASVHWVSFTSAPTLWDITEQVSQPLRGAKPKLKCAAEGDWPIFVTDAPLTDDTAVDLWIDSLVTEWTGKSLKVKAVQEKKLVL
jgi:hypothetical protein